LLPDIAAMAAWGAATDPVAPPFVIWGDGGLMELPGLWIPFTPYQIAQFPGLEAANTAMAGARVSVEHGWCCVTQLFPYLKDPSHLQMLHSPIGLFLPIASFLTNCITCFKGRNRVSDYFGLSPPTLAEYLS